MKTVFLIIVFLHGIIHSLGFFKGFQLKEIKELSLPISKTIGLIWLIATVLFVLYGVLYFAHNKYAWLIGFFAVIVSQFLIILYWKDAKFGTIPNVIILVVALVAYGHFNFQNLVHSETKMILEKSNVKRESILSNEDIKDLPSPVQKWLNRCGAVGKAKINVGNVIQKAELKMKPEQKEWLSAKAVQHTTIDVPAFLWSVDVEMNRLIGFQGRDKFVDGKGEMLIKVNSLINVVNEKGEKLDEGTMQRYLGEMVWFPSLALSSYISWKEINDTTARATMEFKGTKASGTFYFNENGDFEKYSALRFKGNESDAKRYEWVLLVDGYKTFEGIKVPSKMTATWKLESEDWTWLKLEIMDIKYNENVSQK